MKRILAALLALSCAFSSFAGVQPGDTLRLLRIGNSFSVNAVEQNLHQIALSDGVSAIIGNMYIGGCSLERHWKNAVSGEGAYSYRKIGTDGVKVTTPGVSLEKALSDENWDVVTLQQSSPLSGFTDTYEPYLGNLVLYIRDRVPKKTRLMWHQTWAYENFATHTAFKDYGNNSARMFEAIASASGTICQKYGFQIIPCGAAIQNLRTTFVSNNVTSDGFHLNNTVGEYTAACTFYQAVFGRNVIGNHYEPVHIDRDRRLACQISAYEAVRNPYRTTAFGMKRRTAIQDEAGVPEYTLPDALVTSDGKKIKTAKQWEQLRRPELLELFTTQMYGRAPGAPKDMSFELISEEPSVLGGLATRKMVAIYLNKNKSMRIDLMLYIPNNVKGPVPTFLGINFMGNAGTSADETIPLPDERRLRNYGLYEMQKRGQNARRWPYEMILKAGYGVATFYRGDVNPDWDNGYTRSVHKLFFKKGQRFPEPDEWGAIAAWAWGLSRAMDYLETDPSVDSKRVSIVGHSRLGKASLWAGAVDKRFAMVVSNCSGCGGSAISRRHFGETVDIINTSFPSWFCGNFKKYCEREDALPFDQHELMALIAPRPLCIGSGTEDLWADPKGEKIALEEAAKVYRLYGRKAVDKLQYHAHEGPHDITAVDWQYYIDAADKWLK